ncbi:unnamed protein product, partial [Durusdinium trenchii]
VNGQKHLEISPEASIKSLVFGWQELQKYPSVMCWSWTSRGLVTDEEMQALRPEVFKDGKAIKCSSATLKELVPGIPLLLPPTIPQALAESVEGRAVHLWQMRDPQIDELDGSESGFEAQVWVLLPALMQQFVDKHFAAYQLQVDEATKMLNKGRIKQQKYDRIIADAGSKSTLVLFNFQKLEVKLGILQWTPLRVVKAEVGIGKVTLELDPAYIKQAGCVPGFEEYADSGSDGLPEDEPPPGETAENVEHMGVIVPFAQPDEEFCSLQQGLEDLLAEMEGLSSDEDADSQDEEHVEVHFDEGGNLICSCAEVELVDPMATAEQDQPSDKSGGFRTSEAWLYLRSEGLQNVPEIL